MRARVALGSSAETGGREAGCGGWRLGTGRGRGLAWGRPGPLREPLHTSPHLPAPPALRNRGAAWSRAAAVEPPLPWSPGRARTRGNVPGKREGSPGGSGSGLRGPGTAEAPWAGVSAPSSPTFRPRPSPSRRRPGSTRTLGASPGPPPPFPPADPSPLGKAHPFAGPTQLCQVLRDSLAFERLGVVLRETGRAWGWAERGSGSAGVRHTVGPARSWLAEWSWAGRCPRAAAARPVRKALCLGPGSRARASPSSWLGAAASPLGLGLPSPKQ